MTGMEISVEDVARFPAPGMDFPGSFSFSPNHRYVSFLKSQGEEGSRALFVIDLETGKEQLVLDTLDGGRGESLEEELRRQRLRQMHRGITRYFWTKGGKIVVPDAGSVYVLDEIGTLPRLLVNNECFSATDPQSSPDGKILAYVSGGEVWIIPIEGGIARQITRGEVDGTTRGVAEYIAQEEMRRNTGFWWSGEGTYIAFAEVDDRHIPTFKIVHQGNDDTGTQRVETHSYPFAGMRNSMVRLGVTDLEGNTIWLDTSEYEYIARVKWATDRVVFVQCQNREQTQLDLLKFDLPSGVRTKILREESDLWVNLHDMFYPLKDGRFIWASERTGFRHLYMYEGLGENCTAITAGNWQVDSISTIDEANQHVYLNGTVDSYLESHTFRVNFRGGKLEKITNEPGMHITNISINSGQIVDVYHSMMNPPSVELKKLSNLSSNLVLHRPMDDRIGNFKLCPPECYSISAESGEPLSGVVYKPCEKRFGKGPYPTILYVYGGPHAQLVTNGWNMTSLMRVQYLRQKGFLVSILDGRGSARRGLDFESYLKNRMGVVEVKDQVAGVQRLIELGLADPERIGVYGWSYGGYLSIMCLAQAPEVFSAAVAGAPVTSWDGYDTHYTERYMGLPKDNRDGYAKGSALSHMDKIQGNLMLIHGLIDENVHFAHTARLIDALVGAGKDYDLVLFPNERHMPRRQKDRAYIERRIATFFENKM